MTNSHLKCNYDPNYLFADSWFYPTNEVMNDQPRRIIVKFKPIPRGSNATLDSLCEEVLALIPGARRVRPVSRSGRAVFQLEPGADLDALVARISSLDSIDYAEPDVVDRST